VEELDFQALLDRFGNDGFQKGEQVILSNFGTNQTLLSIIFGKPNEIHLIDQSEKGDFLIRQVELFCGSTQVCTANTKIPREKNRADVLSDILAGKLGLGQIVVKHNLPNKRTLVDIGRDEEGFWRTYIIEGQEVFLEIHEYFPRVPFEATGWLQSGRPKMTVWDNEGETYEFYKFVAIGVKPDGGIFLGIEDELLTNEEANNIILQGVQVIGDLAQGLTMGLME